MNLVKALLVFATFAVLTLASPILAQSYGSGDYGACLYGEGCPSSGGGESGGGTTTVATPAGLQVSINLTNGQTIPATGYQVIVTPLNGQGSSFKYVEFFVDGKLAASIAPDPNGTAYWFWDVVKYPGTTLKVIVYDQDGQATTYTFTVKIATTPTGVTSKPTPIQKDLGFFEQIFGYIAENPWTWAVVVGVPLSIWWITLIISRLRHRTPTGWQS
ncbi:MAG TPA: hypothetical protein VLA77_01760 [Candidatus Saccharimonadales bacterium]|nr:hypothetical protein [Candidatus Saccharimonadales bacterium]